MKKYYFLLLASMSLLPIFIHGQAVSKLSHVDLPYSIERTLVREYVVSTSPLVLGSISYIETQNGHFFALDDGSSLLKLVRIDDSITVNDFAVADNQVYFCGSSAWNFSVIGDFRISSFFNSNQNYRVIQNPLMGNTGHVRRLDKMVTYESGGVRRVVAIGQNMPGLYCMVEILYIGNDLYNYRVGELSASYGQNLMSIVLTDNYVVTAGVCTKYLQAARVHDKTDVFATSGIQDNMVYLAEPIHDITQLAMTHIEYDYFAITAISDNYSGANYIQHDGIDFMPFQVCNCSTYVMPLTGYRYPQSQDTNNWKLLGMTKPQSATDQFFLLMETGHYSSTFPVSKTFEYEYYALTSYDALYEEIYSGITLCGIDGYNYNTQYIVNGFETNNNQRLYFGIGRNTAIKLTVPGVSCMPYMFEKQDPTLSINARPIYFPFDVTSGQNEIMQWRVGAQPETYVIETDCAY